MILLGFSSCVTNDKMHEVDPEEVVGEVEITFGVELPEKPDTKVMADNPSISNLMVAVFGGSGYLKEYKAATLVGGTPTNNGESYKKTFKVSLSLSSSHLKVHFIANGPDPATIPFSYEDEVISTLYTEGNNDAYWQRIELPNGITAKKDDETGEYITVGGKYQVTEETKSHFQTIPLIRNFARIEVVDATDDFDLISYVVVNKPTKGSIAPYNSNTGLFETGYENKTYAQLKASYPGNIPLNTSVDSDFPDAAHFPTTAAPVYMFERPVPSGNPTYIIAYGTYKRVTPNVNCYYRLELMDSEGYFAIFRNFKYKVTISSVMSQGSDTPDGAVSSGDVSAIEEALNLTDISDGRARLYVQYTEKTIIDGGTEVTLKYRFIPDINSTSSNPQSNGEGVVDITPGAVQASGAVISGDVIRDPSDDTEGWRTLRFTATTATSATKTQTLRITGNYTYNSEPQKIYRDITYKLLQTQNLEVVCNPKDLENGPGRHLDVLIKLPAGLPRSIFPMKLRIEAKELSITPDNDNLPVNPAKSIIDGQTTKSSYQFIKELSYDAYSALTPVNGKVTVTTSFKTTKQSSDSEVWVSTEYFNKAYDSFTTYAKKQFKNLAFSNYFQNDVDLPVTFTFEMDTGENPDIPNYVTIKLTGLKPDPSSPSGSLLVPVSGTDDTYIWPTGNTPYGSIGLLTSSDRGYYKVEISAIHYEPNSHNNLMNYVNPRFTSQRVPFGVGKTVTFAFSYDSHVTGEDVVFTLSNLEPVAATGQTFVNLGGNQWKFTPANSNASQTVTFRTTTFYSDISVTAMEGDSYNTAGPITLNKLTSFVIPAQALNFTGSYGPTSGSVTLYNSRGEVVGNCSISSYSTGWTTYYRNNADINVDLTKFTENENVYFGWVYSGWWSTTYYYSSVKTLTNLMDASTSNRQEINGFTSTPPTTFP